jgi:hypothetical protein
VALPPEAPAPFAGRHDLPHLKLPLTPSIDRGAESGSPRTPLPAITMTAVLDDLRAWDAAPNLTNGRLELRLVDHLQGDVESFGVVGLPLRLRLGPPPAEAEAASDPRHAGRLWRLTVPKAYQGELAWPGAAPTGIVGLELETQLDGGLRLALVGRRAPESGWLLPDGGLAVTKTGAPRLELTAAKGQAIIIDGPPSAAAPSPELVLTAPRAARWDIARRVLHLKYARPSALAARFGQPALVSNTHGQVDSVPPTGKADLQLPAGIAELLGYDLLNELIVVGTKEGLDQLEALVKDLDQPPAPTPPPR